MPTLAVYSELCKLLKVKSDNLLKSMKIYRKLKMNKVVQADPHSLNWEMILCHDVKNR